MKKRILSLFLVLALCLSLSPTVALADGSTVTTPEGGSGHSNHCVCGTTHSSIGDHTAEAVITEWKAVSELSDITGTGNYYLADDVTLNEQWKIANGTNITLCLNGHKLTSDNTSSSDTILIEGTLTITDCKTTGTITGTNTDSSGNHKVIVVSTLYDNCTLNMYGGTISGINAGNVVGGGVYNEGIFNMYGGTISGNTATKGGGVGNYYNRSSSDYKGDAIFNFYGGIISGNTATDTDDGGGGVFNNGGSFTMSGGTITENTAKNGGGVNNQGTFTMTGGTVSENTATNAGGGVFTQNTGAVFNFNNGEISDNKATLQPTGNDLHNWEGGKMNANGGTVAGNVYNQYGTIATTEGSTSTTTFNGAVKSGDAKNESTISGGTFKGTVTNSNGTISGGTFTNIVNDDLIEFTAENLDDADEAYRAFIANNPTITGSGYIKVKDTGTAYKVYTNSGAVLNGRHDPLNWSDFTDPKQGVFAGCTWDGDNKTLTLSNVHIGELNLSGMSDDADITILIDGEVNINKLCGLSSSHTGTVTIQGKTGRDTDKLYNNEYIMIGKGTFLFKALTAQIGYFDAYNSGNPVTLDDAAVTCAGTFNINFDSGASQTEYRKLVLTKSSLTMQYKGSSDYARLWAECITMDEDSTITLDKAAIINYSVVGGGLDGLKAFLPDGYSVKYDYQPYEEYDNYKVATIVDKDGKLATKLTLQQQDTTAPTGEIKLGTNSWKQLLNSTTFSLFFKETQKVEINASDNSGKDVTIEYLLSDKELTADELAAKAFTDYTGKFDIEPNNKYVIYAKLTDKSGNVAYINSNGIVLDNIAPEITGIENGKTYYKDTEFGVTDEYLDKVTVDGDGITLTDGKYTIKHDGKEHTIAAVDKAGNSTEVKITVRKGSSAPLISSTSEVTGDKPKEDETMQGTTNEDPEATQAESLEKVKSLLGKFSLIARSSKTAKGNIKVMLKTGDEVAAAIKEIESLGYTVKYKYYRSAKKSSGYKSMLTKTSKTYTNTSGKADTRYYYKVQIRVYDENGKCVAKTELKQCKYATRIFG